MMSEYTPEKSSLSSIAQKLLWNEYETKISEVITRPDLLESSHNNKEKEINLHW